jgi:hypothetical protein
VDDIVEARGEPTTLLFRDCGSERLDDNRCGRGSAVVECDFLIQRKAPRQAVRAGRPTFGESRAHTTVVVPRRESLCRQERGDLPETDVRCRDSDLRHPDTYDHRLLWLGRRAAATAERCEE